MSDIIPRWTLIDSKAAYKLNGSREFEPQPPVYAVLTDLRLYDGSKFTLANDIYVISRSRRQFLDGMGDGMLCRSFETAQSR